MIQTGFKLHPPDFIWLCFISLESKAENNQTQCYLGFKNNLLVYKVESSLKVDSPNTVRIIAVERQSTAEIEVQVWKTVEGTVNVIIIINELNNYYYNLTFWEKCLFPFLELYENIDTSSVYIYIYMYVCPLNMWL